MNINYQISKKRKVLIVSIAILISILCIFIFKVHNLVTNKASFVLVGEFEERFIQKKGFSHFFETFERNASYELIETIDFEFFDENLSQTYSGINKESGIVFSFLETDSYIKFKFISENESYEGGFLGDCAVYLKMNPDDIFEFTYEVEDDNIDSPVHGKMNVYKIICK